MQPLHQPYLEDLPPPRCLADRRRTITLHKIFGFCPKQIKLVISRTCKNIISKRPRIVFLSSAHNITLVYSFNWIYKYNDIIFQSTQPRSGRHRHNRARFHDVQELPGAISFVLASSSLGQTSLFFLVLAHLDCGYWFLEALFNSVLMKFTLSWILVDFVTVYTFKCEHDLKAVYTFKCVHRCVQNW